MPTTKADWLGMSAVFIMFMLMIWGIYAIQSSEIREFKRDGVETSAQVVEKYTTSERSSSGSISKIHYLRITFMDRSAVEESEVSVDLLEGEFELPEINIGSFQRAKLQILRRNYNQIETGDSVSILFMPDDPTDARLTDEVLNYQPIGIWVIMGIFGLGLLFCLFKVAIAPTKAPPSSEFGVMYPEG